MDLRIVSGSFKGRIIHCPEKRLSFRPTLERARTSVADMLAPRISGGRAADICAGSGAMGFELISRGAASVDFVENDRHCCALIRSYAEKFTVSGRCRIFAKDAAAYISACADRYDIIFFDPPYDDPALAGLAGRLRRLLNRDGVLVYQHRRHGRMGEADAVEGPEKPFDTRIYGDTEVALYHGKTP